VRAIIATGEDLAEQGRFYDAVSNMKDALKSQASNALASFRMARPSSTEKLRRIGEAAAIRSTAKPIPQTKWVDVWAHIFWARFTTSAEIAPAP